MVPQQILPPGSVSMSRDAESENRLLRFAAARKEPDIPYLLEALLDPEFRQFAAKTLGELGVERAIPKLLRLLDVNDPDTRAAAAGALGKLRAREATSRLIEMAHDDPEAFVQTWAIDALRRIATPDAVQALIELLEHESAAVRGFAAVSLGRAGDQRALDSLRSACRREPWRRRVPYLRAIRALTRG